MTVKELKQILSDKPDDMPVGFWWCGVKEITNFTIQKPNKEPPFKNNLKVDTLCFGDM